MYCMPGTVLSTSHILIYLIFPATILSGYHLYRHFNFMTEETDTEAFSNLIKVIKLVSGGQESGYTAVPSVASLHYFPSTVAALTPFISFEPTHHHHHHHHADSRKGLLCSLATLTQAKACKSFH